jgi:hypothetical protein
MSLWDAKFVGVVSGVVAAGIAQVELMKGVPVPQRTAILLAVGVFARTRWWVKVRITGNPGCLVGESSKLFFIRIIAV